MECAEGEMLGGCADRGLVVWRRYGKPRIAEGVHGKHTARGWMTSSFKMACTPSSVLQIHNLPWTYCLTVMTSRPALRIFKQIHRRAPPPCYATAFGHCSRRYASSKHPKGFVAPTTEELNDLRDRVQDFTSMSTTMSPCSNWYGSKTDSLTGICRSGREIPEKVADKTDSSNDFPKDMWKKLGDAGYDGPRTRDACGSSSNADSSQACSESRPTNNTAVWAWGTRPIALSWKRLVEPLVL